MISEMMLPLHNMEADIHQLYQSDFYRVLDFKCRCLSCKMSKPEYQESFCISFVRKGNFLFNVFRNSFDSYTGSILVTKPSYEHTVAHQHTVPDECSIFDFKQDFYARILDQYGKNIFLTSNDIHSALIHTTAETEFLHYHIMRSILSGAGTKLEIDSLVLEMIANILGTITDYRPNENISDRLKKNHLRTVERAKVYMMENFAEDLSLMQIADNSFVSPFHFSRIFKRFTSVSPHQYLLSLRLKHTELLLRNSVLPVADIAYSSGFNSIEHFSAAFRQRYAYAPAAYRNSR